MDRRSIAAHYLHFWFWIDLFASIPYEAFVSTSKMTRKTLKMVKWFKIPRLLRIGKMLRLMKEHAKFYGPIAVALGYVLSVNFAACSWLWAHDPCGEDALPDVQVNKPTIKDTDRAMP